MRLLLADYSSEDVMKSEKEIMKLIYPKRSHMDFNIACALHFASKGEGFQLLPDYFEGESFKRDFERVIGVFDSKKDVDRNEEVK